jgi:hypothetical protein
MLVTSRGHTKTLKREVDGYVGDETTVAVTKELRRSPTTSIFILYRVL